MGSNFSEVLLLIAIFLFFAVEALSDLFSWSTPHEAVL